MNIKTCILYAIFTLSLEGIKALNQFNQLVDITQLEIDLTFEFVKLISLYKTNTISDDERQQLLKYLLPERYNISPAMLKASKRVFERIPFSISVNIYTGLLRSKLEDKYIRPQLNDIFIGKFTPEEQVYLRIDDFESYLYEIAREIL